MLSFSQSGDPVVFGDNKWIVYAYNSTDPSFPFDKYAGFYIEHEISFDTKLSWNSTLSPSHASSYIGNAVTADSHSFAAKRKGFPPANYSIDIPGHDDNAYLLINGIEVWKHLGCCDSHSQIWTGYLDNNSTVEYIIIEEGGESYGIINFRKNCANPMIQYESVNATYPTGSEINVITPNSTFLGHGFSSPIDIAVDKFGNVYVGDYESEEVKKIDLNGNITTLSDDTFISPTSVAVDEFGSVYVADADTNQIKKITNDGTITILGTGFLRPFGVAVDNSGNVYVADTGNNLVKKIASNGDISDLGAGFDYPNAVAVDNSGIVYVADAKNNRIVKINLDNLTTVVKSDINGLNGLATDSQGNIYYSEYFTNQVNKISTENVTTMVSGGFIKPYGLALDVLGNIYVADSGNAAIVKITVDNQYSIDPPLPAGLTINPLTGKITGTTAVATPLTEYTITVKNSCNATASTTIEFATLAATTWDGLTWDNGTPSINVPAIIKENFNSTENISAYNLKVINEAIVTIMPGHNITLDAALTVSKKSSFILNNNANLLQNADVKNIGNIIVKRETAPLMRQDYVLWSSPVLEQKLQSFSPETLSNRFNTYNPLNNFYESVATPATTNFSVGTGYLIRLPNTHPSTPTIWQGQFEGIPNNGDYDLYVPANKYIAIGNPYPSTVSADKFLLQNEIENGEPIYYWRKTNNSLSTAYSTYTTLGGANGNGDSNAIIPNGVIQVGQGFIVKSNSTNLFFLNSMRIANNENIFLRTKEKEKHRIWLNLSEGNNPVNQMLVGYIKGGTAGVDKAIDGKYFNDSATALLSIINDDEYVIQGRALPFKEADIVPLLFKTAAAGVFTITLDQVDGLFSGSQKIFLKDNIAGILHDLKTSSYTFTSTAGVFKSRFELTYKNDQTLSNQENQIENNSITLYTQNGLVKIDAGLHKISSVKVFDLKGALILEENEINSNSATLKNLKATKQALIVRITYDNDKIIIKKTIN